MGKYGTARQTTNDKIIWHMRCMCFITKAIDLHSEYVKNLAFSQQQGYVNSPQCCVRRVCTLVHCLSFMVSRH